MSQLLICPEGHEWIAEPEGSMCPRCGAAPDADDDATDGSLDDLPPPPGSGTEITAIARRLGPALAAEGPWPLLAGPLPALPGFEILGVLGRGGMGMVYRARQLSPDRLVALKMILTAEHADPEERRRFRAEADAVARLQHPNIVNLYEIGEHAGRAYLVMEYVAGGALDERLRGAPCPNADSARLIATLARAVEYAHSQHVLHRDLKPANVLLATNPKSESRNPKQIRSPKKEELQAPSPIVSNTRNSDSGLVADFEFRVSDFHPKIADFGLAKRLDHHAEATLSGLAVGTPSYMAPEQARGSSKQLGPACDIYALGAILYELLTGRPPFRAASAAETLQQVLHDEPVPPTRLQPSVARDLETICLKCLHKDPARRYARAGDLADDLERFLDGRPIAARPVGTWERAWKWARRRPAAALLGIVSLLGVITIISLGLVYNRWLADENRRYLTERDAAKKAEGEARRQQQRAVAGLRMSMEAVDQFLTRVAETRSLFAVHMEEDRKLVLEDALAFCERFLAENRSEPTAQEEVGLTLLRKAKLLRYLVRFAEADRAYLETLAFLQKLCDDHPDNVAYQRYRADAHYHHGHLQRMHQPQLARQSYEKMRVILAPLAEAYPHDEAVAALYASCLHDLAILAQEAGAPAEAEKMYRAALAVRGGLRDRRPQHPDHRYQCAQIEANLGFLFDKMGRAAEAKTQLLAAKRTLESLRQDHPRSAQYIADYGLTLINLANFYSRRDGELLAEKIYQEAHNLFARLHEFQPGNPTFRYRLAMALHNLGDLANDQRRYAEAEDYLNRSTLHNQALIYGHPRDLFLRRALAGNHLSFVDLALATARKDLAYDKAREAVRLLEELIQKDANTLDNHLDLGKACVFLSMLTAERQEPRKALELCDKALKNLDSVLAKNPQHGQALTFQRQARIVRQQVAAFLERDRCRPPRPPREG